VGGANVSDPQGLAFDPVAADYDLGRPGWPPELLDGIEGQDVLDLAAGTGKLTRLLLERYPHVVAVEPLASMRMFIPTAAESLDGTAEAIPLPDASVDAVFVAEAFHWFDSASAVAEIARVLRVGGAVVICFNEYRPYEPPIGDAARAALNERWSRLPPPGGPKVQSGEWKLGFEGLPFTPLAERAIDHELVTDREGVAAYYVSVSSMGSLPEEERLALRRELIEALADVPYRLPLTARVFTARRT
jgi:SAM-dependent methyltransferase